MAQPPSALSHEGEREERERDREQGERERERERERVREARNGAVVHRTRRRVFACVRACVLVS